MAEYLIQEETLTGIADAIRSKTGETGAISVSDMVSKIEGLQAGGSGGASIETCTVTLLSDAIAHEVYYTTYENGSLVVKTITGDGGIEVVPGTILGIKFTDYTGWVEYWGEGGNITAIQYNDGEVFSAFMITGPASINILE